MPTLLDTCKEIKDGLQRVKVANQTRYEISALQERIAEWDAIVTARTTLKQKSKAVDPTLLSREEIKSIDAEVRRLAEAAQKILNDGGDVQALAEDNLWTRLTARAKTSNEKVRNAALQEWQFFIQSLGPIEQPSALETRMLNTPGNLETLLAYKDQFIKVRSILQADLPTNSSDKSALTAAVQSMQELKERLKSIAPEAIRQFLRAVDSGGASLSMVTPEVMEWLRTNDDPNRFVIKPKGVTSWR